MSPSTINFIPEKTDPSKLRAIAMLQLNSHNKLDGRNSKKTDERSSNKNGDDGADVDSVQLKIGKESIPVKVVRLGTSQVYKLSINSTKSRFEEIMKQFDSEEAAEEDSNQLIWLIKTNRSTFQVKGEFRQVER